MSNPYDPSNHTHTFGDMFGNAVEDKLSEVMKKQVDESIVSVLKLNAMSDEDIIVKIMNEPEVFELLIDPSDDVKKAHLYKTEL